MLADLHLPLKPRSDLALINGLIHILIRHGLIDRDYIAAHTTGFEALRESVRDYTPERVAEITGLSTEALHKTASLYGNARAAFIGWTMGVNHSTQGHRDGQRHQQSGAHHRQHRPRRRRALLDHRPVQRDGHARSGLHLVAARLPQVRVRGRPRRAGGDLARAGRSDSDARAGSPIRTSSKPRSTARSARSGSSRPIRSCRFPNLGVLLQSLETLEFLVVQDGFHPTPTTELADLVLPAAIWGEKEGTYTNSERRVSKVNRAVDPPGEARADFDIFLDARRQRSAAATSSFPAGRRPADAFDEWKRVSAGRLCDYSGMTYERSRRTAASSGRIPQAAPDAAVGHAAPLQPTAVPDRRRQGAADSDRWEPFPEQPTRTSRSC